MKRAMLILLFAATACAVEGRTDTPTIDEPSGPVESIDPCHSDPVLGVAPSVAQCTPGYTVRQAASASLAQAKVQYPSGVHFTINGACTAALNGWSCGVWIDWEDNTRTGVYCASWADADGTAHTQCSLDYDDGSD